MKHSSKIITILVALFLITQYTGLYIISSYSTKTIQVVDGKEITNLTWASLPYQIERPDLNQETSFLSMTIAILFVTFLILVVMRFNLDWIWKAWFFLSVFFCLIIAFGAFMIEQLSFILASLLSYAKIFKRNVITQNISELFIYGGLAAVFVPIINLFGAILFLIIISIYDFIAVFKTKHMIHMAKAQAKMKIFPGLMIPSAKKRVAVLGGGDLGLPLIFTGVALKTIGMKALIIPLFSAAALYYLMILGKKNKFYPAMPFITVGCLIGLLVSIII